MRQYSVKILKGAVASFDDQAHEFALQEMEKTLGAELISGTGEADL
ncbi:MAG TPA: hypothetical protein GX520_01975 [Syntrophaceticus sp.]|nr:hypothetical protein [Syntrophaceticus sp.]